MSLLAYNLTGAPLPLAAGGLTLPASAAPPARGEAVDATSELDGLTAQDYTDLQAQVTANAVEFEWSEAAEFAIGTLVASQGSSLFQHRNSVIFRPGDPLGSRDGVVVTDLEINAAIAALGEGPKWLLLDAEFENPIFTGITFEFDQVILSDVPTAIGDSGFPRFITEDGCVFNNLLNLEFKWNGWTWMNESTTGPVLTIDGFKNPSFCRGSGSVCRTRQSDAANTPHLRFENANFIGLKLGTFAGFRGSPGNTGAIQATAALAPHIEIADTAQLSVFFDGGLCGRNVFTGDGILALRQSQSVHNGAYGAEDQPAFTGTIITNNFVNARMNPKAVSAGPILAWWNTSELADTTSAPVTVNLPPTRNRSGERGSFKDHIGNAGVNNVTGVCYAVAVGPIATTFLDDDGGGDSTILGFDARNAVDSQGNAVGYRPGDTIVITGTGSDGTFLVKSIIDTGVVGTSGLQLEGVVLASAAEGATTIVYQTTIDGETTAVISNDDGIIVYEASTRDEYKIISNRINRPGWTNVPGIVADTEVLVQKGFVIAVEATVGTVTGPKQMVQNGAPATGEVDVQYDAAGEITLLFNAATDEVTEAEVKILPV